MTSKNKNPTNKIPHVKDPPLKSRRDKRKRKQMWKGGTTSAKGGCVGNLGRRQA